MAREGRTDVATLAAIDNSLRLIIDEMDSLIVRTSPSWKQNDNHEVQCGVANAKGEMLAESDMVIQRCSMFTPVIDNWLVTHGVDTLHAGDMFILNDAFSGGSHFNDISFACPVFVNGRLVAWTCAGGHIIDVGGKVPGSMPADARSCYEEGIRLPFVKVHEGGIRNETFFEVLKANSRISSVIESHLEPFMTACRLGSKLFLELVGTYGWETLSSNLDELLNYSERRARTDIRALPNGVYEFEDCLDDDGVGLEPIPFHIKVTIDEDTITYDWTGTAAQMKGPLNLPVAETRGLVYSLFRSLISLDIPHNDGELRPVKVIVPQGTAINPVLPAALGQRGVTVGRVYEVILGAQAQIAPDRMPACPSGIDTRFDIAGYDKERGQDFIFMDVTYGARGGGPSGDGELIAPPYLDQPHKCIEVYDELYPVRINQRALVPDSEGAGKYRGGFGYVTDYELLADEATLSLRTDRRKFAPYGVQGGQDGSLEVITLSPNTKNRDLGKTVTTMKKGDVLRVKVAGAGGWGNPFERNLEKVLDDVLNGLVSMGRAREVYGVAINETTKEVDINETQKLREKPRSMLSTDRYESKGG